MVKRKSVINSTFLASLMTVIGLLLGYFINDYLNKRRELLNEVNKERREVYQQSVNLFIDLINTGRTDNKAIDTKAMLGELNNIYKKNLLYASPEVINAFADFMQAAYQFENRKDPMLFFSQMTKLVGEMRADLGLSNKNLGPNQRNLLRAMITDFDALSSDN